MADQIEQMGLVLETNQKVFFSIFNLRLTVMVCLFACALLTLAYVICCTAIRGIAR